MKKNLSTAIVLPLLIGIFLSVQTVKSQEMNVKVSINADKISGTNKQVFKTLENLLTEFLNTQKWSGTTFSTQERIDCTFNIIINQQSDESNFNAELQITAQRPVYNATYTSNLFNYRDPQWDFSYIEGMPVEYQENRLESNLIAVLSFYSYLILGLDFDSFAPLGGSAYFRAAQQIATEAQSNVTWTGWAPFEKSNSRHGIISAFTDEGLNAYRTLWYTYHRKGLDEMVANADRGRTTILQALPALKEVREARPGTILLQLFSDCKLDEVVNIYSKASSQEKNAGYELLTNLFPTRSNQLEAIKRN
ncbi:MAG: DUF4835 family protein [Dysgonamonadaceae bacterium]|jgi:hypothetical protein|nr:DUF4835 family protein [Dysgonamonadaceae bacterium]